MTDLSNSKQPDIPQEPSRTNGENSQEKGDIVKRTSLSLPSLSGFEQIPFSPSSDWQGKDSTSAIPAISIWEEVPLPTSPTPTMEHELTLPNREEARSQFPLPAVQTEERVAHHGPASADKRATNQNRGSSSLKKVRLRPFEIVTLLAILIFGTFIYICMRTSTSEKIPTPVIHQGSSAITIVSQKSSTVTAISQKSPTITTISQGSRSFQVGTSASIVIKGGSGNVNIHAGSAGTVTVNANNSGGDQGSNTDTGNIQYEQSRDGQGHDYINIATMLPNGNADYNITVPAMAQVDVEVGSGIFSVTGVSGATVNTNSGKLNIENINGPVNVSMQSGDVITNNVKGQITLATINGSIKVKGVTGQLNAVTHNGDVNVKQAELSGQSTLKTSYGSVYFVGSIDPNGTYMMETQSGNIDLTFPGDTAFQLQASTGSGSVHNEFGSDSIGNTPQAQVIANIGSGSITVSKSV